MKRFERTKGIVVAGCAAMALVAGLALPACSTTTATQDATTQEATQQESDDAMQTDVTLDEIEADLAPTVDTDGLSADELLAKGKQYETGDGVVQWYAMAKAYYQAAADAGSSEAQDALDSLASFRDEVLAESESMQGKVFELYRAGVTAGQGGDYETAWASAYDDVFFFNDTENRGLGSMADLLLAGRGVTQDVPEAMKLYTYMASIGKGNGYTALGLVYKADEGTYPGIEHSDEKAMEYFLDSCQADGLVETDFKGPRYAGDLYDSGYTLDDGTQVEPDYAKAAECYQVAADGNGRTFDGTSCYKLAVYCEEGRDGIDQDYKKAAQYYEKAVSDPNTHATMLGIPQTYLSLGRFYEQGLGVEKNLETARSYYQKALEAAQENLDLVDAAGSQDAQAVYDEASEALARLG